MASENFFQSKLFKGIILGIGSLVVLIIIFSLGIFVGEERADFSFHWAEEYHKNFGGPSQGFLGEVPGDDFANANGVSGQIMKIDLAQDQTASLTIKGEDNVEKSILVTNKTTIRMQRKNVKLSDLKINDYVVIIGNPDKNGQVDAEFIRVIPQSPPPSAAQPSGTAPINTQQN